MPPQKRRIDTGVTQQLLDEPYRFEFFQAVRVLEHTFVQQGAPAKNVVPRRLRFTNSLSLAFPPSEIEAIQADTRDEEQDNVDDQAEVGAAQTPELDLDLLEQVQLTPSFFGLLGAGGTLPLPYSERIAEREIYHRDRTARAFFDIFSTRATALFYEAWKKYRPELQYELDRRERFLPLMMSLSGLGLPSLRERMHGGGKAAVFDQSVAFYAGEIRQRPVSAEALQRVLRDYFQVPLQVEQFVGAWYTVPPEQQTYLGSPNAALGSGAIAGERVWQRDLRVRLWIGPLGATQFTDFLPGGVSAQALRKWVTLLTGVCLEYEVRLILRPEDVQGAALGAGGARLGWDAFVATRACGEPRADASYDIHPLPEAA